MVKGKREQSRSLALKAKKEHRNKDGTIGKSEREDFGCGDPNNLIRECPKPSRNYNQRAFIIGTWSDSDEDN
ncbi:hypothetical protein Tco_0557555, partial [Tanacetum coccineum]